MRETQTIDWQPFSGKHKRYIKNALQCKISVAEGAIRSGKTIDNCIIAAAILEQTPDKIHLASGSTIGNAKLNIGACNGFGLEMYKEWVATNEPGRTRPRSTGESGEHSQSIRLMRAEEQKIKSQFGDDREVEDLAGLAEMLKGDDEE